MAYVTHSQGLIIIYKQVNGHNYGGGLDSTTLSRSEGMLDLEFTLGRPIWQKDHAESSSREITLLKC